MTERKPVAVAAEVVPRIGTGYPKQFAEACSSRKKHMLGDVFGLTQFGVNLTILPPGCWSAQRHWHEKEDEFIYVIEGEITLIDDSGEHLLKPGMCAGFKAAVPNGHHLVNKSGRKAAYLEVGSRAPGERAHYSEIDMKVERTSDGSWGFLHLDGTPY
ncbi:MAG: cupin domain-containing protein [Pseudomonadota bacterium]|nr:cupin domain-containing protein [Pseudomonadota bacterium]